jgi:energy-coupling factor transporter ATP-binding protein EcfA2
MSKDEKMRRADDVLLKMGLRDCADVLVGNELLKGISGGEKRRLSIAVEILTEPQILMWVDCAACSCHESLIGGSSLDEPTSGLDAFTASSIIQVLEAFVEEGRTVIITIHQGRSGLFPRFTNLLLLARGGQVAYSGKWSNVLQYFVSLGHECPSTVNPADFLSDIVSVDHREEKNEVISGERVENLIRKFAETQESGKLAVSSEAEVGCAGLVGLEGREPTPMYTAVPLLIRRGLLCFRRRPALAAARIIQVAGISVFLPLFFAPLKTDYISLQNRLGVIQLALGRESPFSPTLRYIGTDLKASLSYWPAA